MNQNSDFLDSAQSMSSATEDRNGQTDAVYRLQPDRGASERNHCQSEITRNRPPNADDSNEGRIRYNNLNSMCSEPADKNEIGNQCDTQDGTDKNINKESQVCSKVADPQEENGQADLLDSMESCSAERQEKESASDTMNKCTIDLSLEGNTQAGLLDYTQSCSAKTQEKHEPSDTNRQRSLAGSREDVSDTLDNTQSFTAEPQEKNDQSDTRNKCTIAGSQEENDPSDNTQLCTLQAQAEGPIVLPNVRSLQQVLQQARTDVRMDVTVNEITGNKNMIIRGNPEEHSITLNAIEETANRMTEEHKEQTTSLKEEIQGTERRLTDVIEGEGSQITTTVTNTGQEVSGRIDETKEQVHMAKEDLEYGIATIKQQNAEFLRDREETTSFNANKSAEEHKAAIEKSAFRTTENISNEIAKVKDDVRDTKETILRTVTQQTTAVQNEMATMTQKLSDDLIQTSNEIRECMNKSNKDTTGELACLKASVDNLGKNQDIIVREMISLRQTFTNQMEELRKSIEKSNDHNKMAMNRTGLHYNEIEQKIESIQENMEGLASEDEVIATRNAVVGAVYKSVKRSERNILDALG